MLTAYLYNGNWNANQIAIETRLFFNITNDWMHFMFSLKF